MATILGTDPTGEKEAEEGRERFLLRPACAVCPAWTRVGVLEGLRENQGVWSMGLRRAQVAGGDWPERRLEAGAGQWGGGRRSSWERARRSALACEEAPADCNLGCDLIRDALYDDDFCHWGEQSGKGKGRSGEPVRRRVGSRGREGCGRDIRDQDGRWAVEGETCILGPGLAGGFGTWVTAVRKGTTKDGS